MAEISIWSVIIVMLMMFAASIGFCSFWKLSRGAVKQ